MSLFGDLLTDEAAVFTGNERILPMIVGKFVRVRKRKMVKVNINKSWVMVFETAGDQTIDFAKLYRVREGSTTVQDQVGGKDRNY